MQKGPWNILNPYKWVLGRRKERTGEGRPNSGEVARRRRVPRGQGGSGAQGAPVEWLGGAWDGWNSAVGGGAVRGGQEVRRGGVPAKD